MQALGAAEDGGQRLVGDADDVVERLLGGQGDAAGLGVEAHRPATSGRVAPNRSRMMIAHIRRAARNLATSSKRLVWQAKKKLIRGAKSIDAKPGGLSRLRRRRSRWRA